MENASLSTGEKLAVWEGVGVIGEVAKIKCKSAHHRLVMDS